MSDRSVLVRLNADDERFGLSEGDVLRVKPFWQDPSEKWEVIERASDGFDPCCTVYRDQVERVPVAVSGNEEETG